MKNHEKSETSNKPKNKLSAPNLNIRREFPINNFNFNPADLLPADDYVENISLFSALKDILCCILKIAFIVIVSLNLIGLILDPSPLVRIYDIFTRPTTYNEFDIPTANSKPDNNEIKDVVTKMHILQNDLNELKNKLNTIEELRLNLEYDLSKAHRKNLEEMGQYFMAIEKKIDDALAVYDADKIGIIDYALETAGGKVVATPDTLPYPSKVSWDFGYFQVLSPSTATQIIQAGNLPGQCFAFHGKSGRIRIRLAEEIKINSVTLEHSPFNLLSDISSCPKNFTILGIEKAEDRNGTELGQFVFKNDTALQNFKINSTITYRYVELFIIDNYGKDEYTCVYRFRVHGTASNGESHENLV